MNLIAIKNYLSEVKIASLGTLCENFKCEPDSLRCMLSHWLRKGCVRQFNKKNACGSSCNKCPALATEIYEWVDISPVKF